MVSWTPTTRRTNAFANTWDRCIFYDLGCETAAPESNISFFFLQIPAKFPRLALQSHGLRREWMMKCSEGLSCTDMPKCDRYPFFFSTTCNIISHQSADVPVHSLLPFHAPNAHTWTYTGRASPAPAVEAVSGICEMPLLRTLRIPRRGWGRSEWWMKNGFEWTVRKEEIGVVSERPGMWD